MSGCNLFRCGSIASIVDVEGIQQFMGLICGHVNFNPLIINLHYLPVLCGNIDFGALKTVFQGKNDRVPKGPPATTVHNKLFFGKTAILTSFRKIKKRIH